METNMEQLLIKIKQVYGEIARTVEFANGADNIAKEMKSSVISKVQSKNLMQSYRLLGALNTTTLDVNINKTGSKVVIGYANINDMNSQTRRGRQMATFLGANGEERRIGLRAEPNLPSWIIAEYGRKSGNNGADTSKIPEEFIVPYMARDKDKQFMVGPSSSLHSRKPVYFMANLAKSGGGYPSHPGIREKRIFRDGLKEAKPVIYNLMGEAIFQSLESLARIHGGRVERI